MSAITPTNEVSCVLCGSGKRFFVHSVSHGHASFMSRPRIEMGAAAMETTIMEARPPLLGTTCNTARVLVCARVKS